MSDEIKPTPECDRREKVAVGKIQMERLVGDEAAEEAYFAECREMCCEAEEGLQFDAVRSIVWKDLVLGLGAARPVPYLSQSIIRQEKQQLKQLQEQREEALRQGRASATDLSEAMTDESIGEDLSPSRTSEAQTSSTHHSRNDSTIPAASLAQEAGTVAPEPRLSNRARAGSSTAPKRRRAASQAVRGTHRARAPMETEDLRPLRAPASPSPHVEAARPPVTLRLPENCQPRVVEADIQRSLWALYPEATERDGMRRQLKDMLLRVLANNPTRYYYQGLHEVMGYVMYVLAPTVSTEVIVSVCEGLLRTRWASFSEATLSSSEALLYAMHAVIAEEDAALAVALEECGVAPESHYAVSWVITWFSHSITDNAVLGRLFDYFIVDEDGLGVIFFTAAYMVSQRKRIMQWVSAAQAEAREFEGDAGVIAMAKVYALLNKMPADTLATATVAQVSELVRKADLYRERHLELVVAERDNFIQGNVRKLGFLANQRTRNAALRLLWALLPREWRNPATRRQGVGRMVLMASAVLATAVVLMSAKENPNWTSHLFH